ncbi:hypothetical protein [Actinomadura violacea]|nr:hypothetical protein [Actinomadura violacea]
MVDDRIDGRRIAGFVYNAPAGAETPLDSYDHVLVDGDEGVPVRSLPECLDRVERCGPLPPQRSPEAIHRVEDVAVDMPDVVGRLTDGAPEPVGPFFALLFARVWELGHLIWAVGGVVRDLVGDGPGAKVNDLDFSGTVPPGLMASLVRDVLSGMGIRGCYPIVKVSSGRVCSATLEQHGEPLLEYKALDLRGFPFAVTGGDLGRDAEVRDLTVNSIHYDPRYRLILDPTRRGLAHLGCASGVQDVDDVEDMGGADGGVVRVLWVPYRDGVPAEQAGVLLRLVKFVVRWRGEGRRIEFAQPVHWAAALPADLLSRVSADGWKRLRKARDAYLGHYPAAAALEAAGDIGPMAVRLLRELDVRGGR